MHTHAFTLILVIGGLIVLLSKFFSADLSALGAAGGTIAGLALVHYRQIRQPAPETVAAEER
ncbi:hypothetical protein L248_1264 [Schleiferilactobacillus shenzhenensis LY-73]|uniref:Uncharacterized protein n=1 Tax=Schleiferilactobacillus shenzhenensis LY-73 TaxID=1231336 RepID=U4TXV1_9LACO|nr:hypothetical protein L248_1264 [Schleiferilactobacillus shenzhenensis LY-73]